MKNGSDQIASDPFYSMAGGRGVEPPFAESIYMDEKNFFSTLIEVDRNGIHHNAPNAKYDKWETNSLGFRGSEIELEKKEGQIRIVCLGVSETFGYHESQDKEWPSQLGKMLRDQFPKIEVINAAVIGLNLKENRDYVEKYVLPLKPDIMIILQTFLIYTHDLLMGKEGIPLMYQIKVKKAKNPIKAFILPIRILSKLEEIMKRYLPKCLLAHNQTWRLRKKIKRKEKRRLKGKKPMDEVPENIIFEFERDLRSFVQYLKENNVVTLLSTYPCLITPFNKDIHSELLMVTRLYFCIELSEEGVLDASIKSNDAVRRIAKEQNTVLMDNDYLIPKTLEYFSDNFHYTDKGAELMARNFYTILNHRGLIK